jgi:hypothetical protein
LSAAAKPRRPSCSNAAKRIRPSFIIIVHHMPVENQCVNGKSTFFTRPKPNQVLQPDLRANDFCLLVVLGFGLQ